MAVTAQTPYTSYTAAPGAVTFSTEFRVLRASDLVVRVNGVTQTTGFTLIGLGDAGGVDVQFSVSMVGGEFIELFRVVPLTRSTDYQQLGDFLSPVVNQDFDRLWMSQQDQGFLINGALRLPFPEQVASLPAAAGRTRKLFYFNETGAPVMLGGTPNTVLGFDNEGDAVSVAPTSGSATDLALSLAGTGGAGLVGLPSGRTVEEKLEDLPANAADYQSLPDSGVDEWARLNAALSERRIVELDEGVYLVSRGLRQVLNGSILRGAGKGKTIIRAISPTADNRFGGTDGNEAVVWALAPEGAPLIGLKTEDLTIDCAGLMTGLPSGDVRLKGHHYRRVHGFEVNRVNVVECGSYAFWANDKTIESGGTITECHGEYNECEAVDSGISFETTGRCFITYNRPRATQTRSSWVWPILETYHFYGGDGLITVNNGYARCRSSTIIGPALTQKNVIWNGGYFEQIDPATTAINMGEPTGNYDGWAFNDVTMIAAGQLGAISFGGLGGADAKMVFKGGKFIAAAGVGPVFTAVSPGFGVVEMHGVDCKSTLTGAAVPFSLIVTGAFKSFKVFGGNQEVFGPAVGSSPVNAPSASFNDVRFVPSSSVTERVRQSTRGSAVFANGGGFAQINFAIPLNVVNKAKIVVVGAVEASSTGAGGSEAVAYSWNNPSGNIINILAPVAAVGRTFNYLVTEYE